MCVRLLAVLSIITLSLPPTSHAATFVVDTLTDTVDATPGDGIAEDGSGDTTLRAAIQEANALAGDDVITFPAGTVTLSIAGLGEDAAATGDLDITSNITINGADAATTIISGANLDRVFHVRLGASLVLNDVTVRDGSPGTGAFAFGGGVFNDNAIVEINDCIIRNNEAPSLGGGIMTGASTGVTATTTLRRTTVTQNIMRIEGARPDGAGITNIAGGGSPATTATTANTIVEDCIITNNAAIEIGNGILNESGGPNSFANLTVTDTTIDRNDGAFMSAVGGGIANFAISEGTATATVTRCTISNHELPGGGIWNAADGGTATVTVLNSTISGNETFEADEFIAAGIMNEAINEVTSVANMIVRNSTITNNTTTELVPGGTGLGGGAIRNQSNAGTATFTLENTIVAGNTSAGEGPDVAGTFVSDGNNLIGDTTDSVGFGGSDILNVDPLLAALADNGGPMLTHAIPVTSPARNTGSNTGAPATDQRGLTRIVNGTIDIGAFEFQGLNPVFADFAFGGSEEGTELNPFNTLIEALGAAADGAIVNIDPGSSTETVTITQAVTLQSTGGTVTIGAVGARRSLDTSATGFVSKDD